MLKGLGLFATRAITLFLLSAPAWAGSPATVLYIDSQSGSIGGGQTVTINGSDETFTPAAVPAVFGGVQVNVGTISDESNFWTISFNLPKGATLQPGVYDHAWGYPSQSAIFPGLSIVNWDEGCPDVGGRFVIYDIQVGSDGTLLSLAVDFEQNCENNTGTLFGKLRYNSTVPLNQPSADAGSDQSVVQGDLVALSSSFSDAGGGSENITSYQWEQLSGPSVGLSDSTAADPTFTAPPVPPGGTTLVFQLTITNSDSVTSTAQISVHDANSADPFNSLRVEDPNLGTGVVTTSLFKPNDGHFVMDNPPQFGDVQFEFVPNDAPGGWYIAFAGANQKKLHTGLYNGAIRAIPSPQASPGIAVEGGNINSACDAFSGHFYVRQAVYDNQGNVAQLAVDFVSYCDNALIPVRGKLRFNSTVPINDPNVNPGPDQSTYEGFPVTLDGSQSTGGSSSIASYKWSQIVKSGDPVVVLPDPSAATMTFLAPHVPAGGLTLTFQLQVTNTQNLANVDIVNVTIGNENDSKTAFYYESDADDPVGGGSHGLIVPRDVIFDLFQSGPLAINADIMLDHPRITNDIHLFFKGHQDNTLLKPGIYRVTVPDSPANMHVSMGSGFCTPVDGMFIVREIAFTSRGILSNAAVDFVQRCTGSTGLLRGTLRYNSTVPLRVLRPTADPGLDQTINRPSSVNLDGTLSFPGWGNITSYAWKQVSGPAVTLIGQRSPIAQFNLPASLIPIGGTNLVFALTVSNSFGLSDTASTTVTAIQPSSSSLTLQSDAGDPVGGGASYSYATPTMKTSLLQLPGSGIQVLVSSGPQNSWMLGFAAAGKQPLAIGTYNGAIKYTGFARSSPSLYVDTPNRHAMCKAVSGDFNVLDVQYSSSGAVESLAIDFDQTCGSSIGALHGKLRYHSAVP